MVNAFFSQHYLALKDQILAAVPAIKWVDLYLGQLESYDTRPAVTFPCVLVDYPDADYKELGGLEQWGDLVVQLRLGFAPFSGANSAAPESVQEKALGHYEIENDLFRAIHGWMAEYNGAAITEPHIRKKAATEARNDPYRVRVLLFTTAYQDDGAAPTRTTVKATMQINMGE